VVFSGAYLMEKRENTQINSGAKFNLTPEYDILVESGYCWIAICSGDSHNEKMEIVGLGRGLVPTSTLTNLNVSRLGDKESNVILIGGYEGCSLTKISPIDREEKREVLENYKYALLRLLQISGSIEKLRLNRVVDVKALKKLELCQVVDVLENRKLSEKVKQSYGYVDISDMYSLRYPKYLGSFIDLPDEEMSCEDVSRESTKERNSRVICEVMRDIGVSFEVSEIEDALEESNLGRVCNNANMNVFAETLNKSGIVSITPLKDARKVDNSSNVRYLIVDDEKIKPITDITEIATALSKKKNVYVIYGIEDTIISLAGLFKFFSSFRRSFALILIASLLIQLFTLILPLSFQQVIDKVIGQQNVDLIPVFMTAMVTAAILAGAFRYLRSLILFSVATTADRMISKSTLTSLINAEFEFYGSTKRGDLVGRVSETTSIKNFFTGPAVNTILDTLFSFTYLAILLVYSVKLTILGLLPVPVYLFASFAGSPYYKKLIKKKAGTNSVLISYMLEIVSGIQSVKLQGYMSKAIAGWEYRFNNVQGVSYKLTSFATILGETSQFLVQASSLIILFFGAKLVIDGEMTLGELISFRIISGFLTSPLLRLTNVWQALQDASLSIERINFIREWRQERVVGGLTSIAGEPREISICDLEYFYKGKTVPVLSSLSMEIQAGSINGIVGKSGSGKSTLFKVLTGLYTDYLGSIFIGSTELGKISIPTLRKNIYCVPQDAHFFSGSVEENVCYGKEGVTSKEIYRALELAKATEFIDKRLGLRTKVEEGAQNLSGGQKQRLALARLFLNRPNIILLDECTSALDPITEREVLRNIMMELRGSTIIIITHRVTTTRMCDVVFVVKDGSIENFGPFKHLEKCSAYFQKLLEQGMST